MARLIDADELDRAMTLAAVNDRDSARRTWTKAICVVHDAPTADVNHGQHESRAGNKGSTATRHENTCADCIHESACQMWNIGSIHDTKALHCVNHETVKESTAYFIGRMDGRAGHE